MAELREINNLLIDLKIDLIYSFDKLKRFEEARKKYNEMRENYVRNNTFTPAIIEKPTPAIELDASGRYSSHQSVVIRDATKETRRNNRINPTQIAEVTPAIEMDASGHYSTK